MFYHSLAWALSKEEIVRRTSSPYDDPTTINPDGTGGEFSIGKDGAAIFSAEVDETADYEEKPALKVVGILHRSSEDPDTRL